MLWYIIDGWNLINKLSFPKDTDQVCSLIEFIKRKHLTGSRTNRVTIVLDGFSNRDIIKDKEYEIIFSGRISADDKIINIVKNTANPKIIVVVSDDNYIIKTVRYYGANNLSTKEFINKNKKVAKVCEENKVDSRFLNSITEEMRRIWLNE